MLNQISHQDQRNEKSKASIIFTQSQVKRAIEEGFSFRCPDSIAQEVLKQGNSKAAIKRKISEVRAALAEMNRLFKKKSDLWLRSLEDNAGQFVRNPDSFTTIAKTIEEDSPLVFYFSSDERLSRLFLTQPELFGEKFSELVKLAKGHTLFITHALKNQGFADSFIDYCHGRTSKEKISLMCYSTLGFVVELGMPLDDLHENQEAREKYLASLSTEQVFGLLLSSPEHFYTSTNHMLFDRLKKDLKGRPVQELFIEYRLLGTEQCRNFLFRAMTYDRLYGSRNSLFDEKDLEWVMEELLSPMRKAEFDPQYYYLLTNSISGLKQAGLAERVLGNALDALQGECEKNTRSALKFIIYMLEPGNASLTKIEKKAIELFLKKGIFHRENYEDGSGKLVVLQIFDKEDTGKDHWPMTIEWLSNGGTLKPKKGAHGELIFETKNSKVTLFMGENNKMNREFTRDFIEHNPSLIISFRGHSYHLLSNMPFDIFGNKPVRAIFIPGSCGSSASIPSYITSNPKSNIMFFGYTSTGKGQVTNCIIDALISANESKPFSDILSENEKKIMAHGGKIKTIRAWSDGEAMLYYVYWSEKRK